MDSQGAQSLGQTHPAPLDWALLCSTVLLWGSTFAGLTLASRTIDPYWIIAGRMSIATAFLAIPAVIEARTPARPGVGYEPLSWRAIGWMALVGTAFTALPYLAYASAARTTPSSILAICNGAAPIFTALQAHMFLSGERLTWSRAAGALIGFLGLVVLLLPELRQGVTASGVAMVLSILAAALYAGGNIATRKAPRIRPIQSSFILVASGALVSIPAALAMAPWPQDVSAESAWALLGIGIGPTGIAMIVYVVLVQRAGPVFVSFATYLTPLVALGLGMAFLGERPGWEALVALVLVLAGVAIANLRTRKLR